MTRVWTLGAMLIGCNAPSPGDGHTDLGGATGDTGNDRTEESPNLLLVLLDVGTDKVLTT